MVDFPPPQGKPVLPPATRQSPHSSGLRRYIVAAFSFGSREYISKGLYARLTGVLLASWVLLAGGVILVFTAWPHEVKRNSNTLTGLGVAVTVVTVAMVLWIAIRQASLIGSRFRASEKSFAREFIRSVLVVWFLSAVIYFLDVASSIPSKALILLVLVTPIRPLFLDDSEEYYRYKKLLQEKASENAQPARGQDSPEGRAACDET